MQSYIFFSYHFLYLLMKNLYLMVSGQKYLFPEEGPKILYKHFQNLVMPQVYQYYLYILKDHHLQMKIFAF